MEIVSKEGANIENMVNKSRGDAAYTIIDLSALVPEAAEHIRKVDGVIRVRVL